MVRAVPRQKRQDQAAPRLPRLPPGRHGLSRKFVARNQRQRLVAATVAVVAAHGVDGAPVATICAAAGVSRRVFYANFESRQDCVLTVYDESLARLCAAAREAAADAPDWPRQVVTRLRAALELFAAEPDLARFCLIAPQRAGGAPAARYRQAMNEALVCLASGRPATSRQPSEGVAVALIGGIAALVSHDLEASGSVGLEALLPDLVELFLSPYLGRSAAVEVAAGALA